MIPSAHTDFCPDCGLPLCDDMSIHGCMSPKPVPRFTDEERAALEEGEAALSHSVLASPSDIRHAATLRRMLTP